MTRYRAWLLCVGVLAAWLMPAEQASAQGTGAKKNEGQWTKGNEPGKKSATHKVEKKPFKIEVVVKSVLEPAITKPIIHRPELLQNVPYSPGPMTIRTMVEHGAVVRSGDILATF
ncbi:MAG: hypothetical protein NZO58_12475, partial [Gemmataceae bacterium]|nr:hypothetical protein [Gemmataceae bacterium]